MKNNIEIVKNIEMANCVTHGGIFHADEIFSTIMLAKVLPQVKLCRTFKVPESIAEDVIVYDIGGGAYDHHQRGFDKMREDGIKYSSFGLLYQKFGNKLLANVENAGLVFRIFDEAFIEGIDAIDNGQVERSNDVVQIMSVSSVIASFNPNWDEEANSDQSFLKALEIAEVIFDNALNSAMSKAKAKNGVEEGIENSANGIMVLDQFMPWQEFLFESSNEKATQIFYVVFPSNRGGYNVVAVPDSPGSFGQRKSLPENWAGLRGKELAEASGVPTANFCHLGKFICGADDFEGAMTLAKLAIEA